MTENNFFSPTRFGRLCSKHLLEGRRTLLAIGALAIGYMLLCGFINFNNPYSSSSTKCGSFFTIFCVLGIIVSSLAFRNYSTPQQRLSAIMTPASQFEKFLFAVLIVLPVYTVVNFICFAVGDAVSTFVMKLALPDAPITYFDYHYLLTAFPKDTVDKWIIVGAALAYQSFFFLGSIVFHRISFFKTILALWAISTVYTLVGAATFKIFFNPATVMNHRISPEIENNAWLFAVILFAIAIFNYFVAWLRLRESETVNRW